jgi:hypothetical protein
MVFSFGSFLFCGHRPQNRTICFAVCFSLLQPVNSVAAFGAFINEVLIINGWQ